MFPHWRFYHVKKYIVLILSLSLSLSLICICVCFTLVVHLSLVIYLESSFCNSVICNLYFFLIIFVNTILLYKYNYFILCFFDLVVFVNTCNPLNNIIIQVNFDLIALRFIPHAIYYVYIDYA